MARKAKEVKASETKEVVKAAPVEEVKAPAKVETKKTEKKPAAKKAAAPAKKAETMAVEVKAPAKAEPKKETKKPTAKKAAPAKTAPVKKEAAKASPAKEETKKAAPAKPAKIVTTSVLQVAGDEFDFDKVVKAVEGLKKKNAGKNLEIYIKPEDRAIYYVVNGKGGKKIDL
ncbi:MAG: hypothetical protein J6X60_13915 [Ruminiclostridium sp.]|nr:hypothetical protein [Ruminiclostridium sp.]